MNEGSSRRLIDQLGDGYFRSALDGRLLWVNPAGAKMLRYSGPEEMIDRINVRNLYEDAAQRDVFLAELQANGEVTGFEASFVCEDGESLRIDLTAALLFDDDGKPFAIDGVIRDLSGGARRQQTLAERSREAELLHLTGELVSEADSVEVAMRRMLDLVCEFSDWPVGHAYTLEKAGTEQRLVSTGIWHFDDPNRYTAFRTETGKRSFDRGIGLPGRVLQQGDVAWIKNVRDDSDFPRKAAAAEAGIRGAFAIPVIGAGATVAVLEFYSRREMEPGESMIATFRRVASQMERVFERKQAEGQLRKLSRAVEQSSSSVIITDLAGSIEYANPKFTEVTGYAVEEALGKNPRMLKSGSQPKEFYADMWATIASGREWHGEFCNRKKNGGLYWEAASISPIRDASGKVTHYVAIKDDITERKRMEEELLSARKTAESANRTKSAFLANMSHELRTPMNAIIGYSEMLIEEAEDLEPDEFVPDLEKIRGAGKHLLALINDILDLSKIEAGKMELYRETFDLSSMIDDVAATVDTLIKKKNNTLQIEKGDNLGSIHADMTKIRQMLFNLISNAAKFTERGTITLGAHREATDDGDRFTFVVKDTGIGVAADKIGKLFEEFTQADASTTRQFGGTGLGLAITRRFCQMMGGDISAESTLGEGSTFTIQLPAEGRAGAGASTDQEPEATTGEETAAVVDEVPGGLCVLVIDDEPNARDLMQRSLTKDGFSVILASSGEEGLRLARESRPDLITLDVMMPGMDGWAVLRELKADSDLNRIPVIMVTMVDDQSMGYTLGAADYITKPVDHQQLLTMLGRYRCTNPPCTVLLIEDDPDTRTIMRRQLEGAKWTVREAENGKQALDRVREDQPELILLDLMMPEMDGFEFLLELRRVEAWREIPVVIVSAKDLTEEDRRRLGGDAQSIMQKGAYSRQELLEQVRAVLAHCSTGRGESGNG